MNHQPMLIFSGHQALNAPGCARELAASVLDRLISIRFHRAYSANARIYNQIYFNKASIAPCRSQE
jgi:hypothetical protein